MAPNPPPKLSSPEAYVSDLKQKLKSAKKDVEEERKHHDQTKIALQKKEKQAGDVCNRWNQTALELNAFVRQSQGVDQLTDDEIHQKGRQLRNDIRKFVIQHVAANRDQRISPNSIRFMERFLQLPQHATETYLRSPDMRPAVVRAFLWAFINFRFFDLVFSWAPIIASDAMRSMSTFFESMWKGATTEDSEANRKFHMWRASTSTQILGIMALDEKQAGADRKLVAKAYVQRLCEHLLPLFSSKSQVVENHLLHIIDWSLELGKQFVRQVAHISWKFASTPGPFNPDTMTLEGGQKHTGDGQVILVLAPALVRSSKPSGDGYDITRVDEDGGCL